MDTALTIQGITVMSRIIRLTHRRELMKTTEIPTQRARRRSRMTKKRKMRIYLIPTVQSMRIRKSRRKSRTRLRRMRSVLRDITIREHLRRNRKRPEQTRGDIRLLIPESQQTLHQVRIHLRNITVVLRITWLI